MNKTVAINISGIMFNIEEDAFAKLKSYLDTIRNYFQNTDGSDEIMGDIESRVAELFQGKVTDQKQVVNLSDVNYVIEVMGQPEAYADADMEFESFEGKSRTTATGKKRRVFRDPDSKVVGGVCSGIGHYFGWDPIWVRLFFVIITLTVGFGVIAYILLWIVIPKAVTTAEKIEMTGERVTVENIKKKVNEGISSLSDLGDQAARGVERSGSKFFDFLETVFKGLFGIAGKILGFLFLMGGLVVLIGILYAFIDPSVWHLGGSFESNGLRISDLREIMFNSSQQHLLLLTGFALLIIIPLLLIIYGGLKLLFNIQFKIKGLGIILFSLWILGMVIAAFAGFSLAKEFIDDQEITQIVELEDLDADTLFLSLNDDIYFSNYFEGHHREENFLELLKIDDEEIIMGSPILRIHQNETDSIFSLKIRKASNASSHAKSIARAENVNYTIDQNGNKVAFDPFYSFPKADKIRGQEVYITLMVPVGKSIYLGPLMDRIIYNVKNVSDTYDGDMVNRTWTMTEEGLKDMKLEPI